jgi:HTH-type transcriptional regulator, competence development regulator
VLYAGYNLLYDVVWVDDAVLVRTSGFMRGTNPKQTQCCLSRQRIQYQWGTVNCMAINVDFGGALKGFREERTLSLRELATLSEVDHAYIHRLESGEKIAPSAEIFEKLVRGLKLAAHKRQLLEILSKAGALDSELVELGLEDPKRMDAIQVAATMSFRGARPQSKMEWDKKLTQIEALLGNDRR